MPLERGVVLRTNFDGVLRINAVLVLHPASYGSKKAHFTFFLPYGERRYFFMKKSNKLLFGSLKIMACAAILAAMSIVLGKFLAFNVTPSIRISFENLPVIISGIFFGPVVGAAVGAVADLLGCVMVGYTINPIITLGAALIGFISGIVPLVFKRKNCACAILSVSLAHIIGSVIVKTVGLAVFYSLPFIETALWRLLTYVIVGGAECAIICLLLKNSAFVKQVENMLPKEKKSKMTYEQALEYIHSVCWKGSRPGLERTTELLEKMGNPQDKLKFIHVAGTNGKGSFCSMTANVLKHAGYKVGLYTSPFVLRFNERMKINGEDIPDTVLAKITEYVKPFAESMTDSPTEFELITAIALEYFAREGCDVVVLECGMGGRLDSTNIIKNPLLSVITGISFDHTAFLGNTIPEIAREKAGIIKENCPVLLCSDNSEAAAVIKQKADGCNSPYFEVDRSSFVLKNTSLDGSVFDFGEYKDVKIPLLGSYQPHNACNVLTAINLLNSMKFYIPIRAIYDGLATVEWKARFEKLCDNPTVISDGGHNPEGIDAAVESVKLYFPEQKVIFVTGVMADKDYKYMAGRMSEVASCAFCVTPDNPRALSASDFADVFEGLGIPATPCDSVATAITLAKQVATDTNTPIICLGSLYMYCEVYKAIKE